MLTICCRVLCWVRKAEYSLLSAVMRSGMESICETSIPSRSAGPRRMGKRREDVVATEEGVCSCIRRALWSDSVSSCFSTDLMRLSWRI